MASQTALVTGGTGFVGSWIVKALADAHPTWSITSVDLKGPCREAEAYRNVHFAQADVTNQDQISGVISYTKPDVVIHAAGVVPPLTERYRRRWERRVFAVNVEGTRNTLVAAQEAKVSAFVYTSSCCSVTDDMRFPYANINEKWPTSKQSSIYGESKVIIFKC